MSTGTQLRIVVEEKDGVKIVTFRDSKILEDRTIQQLGRALNELAQGEGTPRIVLDFTGVKYLSSLALGKLIAFRRKVDQLAGKVMVCEIHPEMMDLFKIARCDDYFDFVQDRKDAISGLKQP